MAVNAIVTVRFCNRFKFSTPNTPKTGHRDNFNRCQIEGDGILHRGASRQSYTVLLLVSIRHIYIYVLYTYSHAQNFGGMTRHTADIMGTVYIRVKLYEV